LTSQSLAQVLHQLDSTNLAWEANWICGDSLVQARSSSLGFLFLHMLLGDNSSVLPYPLKYFIFFSIPFIFLFNIESYSFLYIVLGAKSRSSALHTWEELKEAEEEEDDMAWCWIGSFLLSLCEGLRIEVCRTNITHVVFAWI